jgi:hypothetical protein
MNSYKRIVFPIAIGMVGALFLLALYVGILILGGSADPFALAWEKRVSVLPLALGFGIQVGLYILLRRGGMSPLQRLTGRTTTSANGGVSTLAMVACCAASLPNLLPLLGASALAAVLSQWNMLFMIVALAANVLGIGVMLYTALKLRNRPATAAA